MTAISFLFAFLNSNQVEIRSVEWGKRAQIDINRDTLSTRIWMSYSRTNVRKEDADAFSFFFLVSFRQSKQINLRPSNANGWCFHAQLERMTHSYYGVIPVTFALAQAQDKSVCAWPGTGLGDTPVIETNRQWDQQVIHVLVVRREGIIRICVASSEAVSHLTHTHLLLWQRGGHFKYAIIHSLFAFHPL